MQGRARKIGNLFAPMRAPRKRLPSGRIVRVTNLRRMSKRGDSTTAAVRPLGDKAVRGLSQIRPTSDRTAGKPQTNAQTTT